LAGATEEIHETRARITGLRDNVLSPVSPKYEAGNLSIPPRRSVNYSFVTEFYEVQSEFVDGFSSWKTN
jgi:hypothetical protein